MLTISSAIIRNDYLHLSKDDLKNICIDLKMPNDGTKEDLINRIFDYLKCNPNLKEPTFKPFENHLYTGKTSLTWYSFEPKDSLERSKDKIQQFLKDKNIFNEVVLPPNNEIFSNPIPFSGISIDERSYYLRFIYRSANKPIYQGNEVTVEPKMEIVTVLVDEINNCIEIRNSKKSKTIAEKFAKMVGENVFLKPKKISEICNNDIEFIANKLNGRLIDSTSKPELIFDDFDQSQSKAVFNMLKALDAFFEDDDIDNLSVNLKEARSNLGKRAEGVPFTALVLAGLQKVGLGVNDSDLRNNQLYMYLNDYMQHQGGYISFDYEEESYTIRVVFSTNSINFLTPATEEVIKYLRNTILH